MTGDSNPYSEGTYRSMTTQEEQFAAFQAWQAGQEARTATELQAEAAPTATIAEVLKSLVNSARFASEEVVRGYHAVIDEWHTLWTDTVAPTSTDKPAPTPTDAAPNG